MCNSTITLDEKTIDLEIEKYADHLAAIGNPTADRIGIELFRWMKRDPIGVGPYPEVTFFEASNRIMTDLVILHGIKWMFGRDEFPFERYEVEFGNSKSAPHDIMASMGDFDLIGEAFNVARSFFQTKKASDLAKLRKSERNTTHEVIIANTDAVKPNYRPRPREGEFIVLVDIIHGDNRIFPTPR